MNGPSGSDRQEDIRRYERIEPSVSDEQPSIIPRPAKLQLHHGRFRFTIPLMVIVPGDDPSLRVVADHLTEVLRDATGFSAPVRRPDGESPRGTKVIRLVLAMDGQPDDEGYRLKITPDTVEIVGRSVRGVFYAVQTIRQLLADPAASRSPGAAGVTLPCLLIHDQPRYAWRGMLLDCSRHFMPKPLVLRYIDLLAYHKMNVLHWHLTDDQGWRLQIERYPALTEVGAWRRSNGEKYGGFYSREDVHEIVAYAESRFVNIVPEIEMPGHSVAALASYPDLSCHGRRIEVDTTWGVKRDVLCVGKDQVYRFIEDVLDEVCALFPSRYIHTGSDECPRENWRECPDCLRRMRLEHFSDDIELHHYFVNRVYRILEERGRTLIAWDDIGARGLPRGAVLHWWLNDEQATEAVRLGRHVIANPHAQTYLDYSYENLSLEKMYAFDPVPPGLDPAQEHLILGGQGSMWSEYTPAHAVDGQVFPRLCALGEVLWSPKDKRSWPDFQRRIRRHARRLEAMGVRYHRPAIEGLRPVGTPIITPAGKALTRQSSEGSTTP